MLALIATLNRDPTRSRHSGAAAAAEIARYRNQVINAIDPAKDVDGLHPNNAGRLAGGFPGAVAVHAARLHHPDQERA